VQQFYPCLGEGSGRFEFQFVWQLVHVAAEDWKHIAKDRKASITTDFAERAHDSDRAKLLEDIRIAQQGAFEGGRIC